MTLLHGYFLTPCSHYKHVIGTEGTFRGYIWGQMGSTRRTCMSSEEDRLHCTGVREAGNGVISFVLWGEIAGVNSGNGPAGEEARRRSPSKR